MLAAPAAAPTGAGSQGATPDSPGRPVPRGLEPEDRRRRAVSSAFAGRTGPSSGGLAIHGPGDGRIGHTAPHRRTTGPAQKETEKPATPPALPAAGVRIQGPPARRGDSERAAKEHRPSAAEVIAGGQTISTHCLACGHRGELDPRVLAVAEGEATTMGAIERRLPPHRCGARFPAHGTIQRRSALLPRAAWLPMNASDNQAPPAQLHNRVDGDEVAAGRGSGGSDPWRLTELSRTRNPWRCAPARLGVRPDSDPAA
jgi:hypothetical protein